MALHADEHTEERLTLTQDNCIHSALEIRHQVSIPLVPQPPGSVLVIVAESDIIFFFAGSVGRSLPAPALPSSPAPPFGSPPISAYSSVSSFLFFKLIGYRPLHFGNTLT